MLSAFDGRPVAVAAGREALFFAVTDRPPTELVLATHFSVVEVPKGGGERRTILTLDGKRPIRDMAVDSDQIYLTTDHELIRMAVDGSGRTTLATGFGPWIAVHGGYVYGYGWRTTKESARVLSRLPTSGGAVETLYAGPRVAPIAVQPPATADIVVETGGIFVVDPELRQVVRFGADGRTQQRLAEGAGRVEEGCCLVVTDESVYWRDLETVWAVPKSGGVARSLGGGCHQLPMVLWRGSVYAMAPDAPWGRNYKCLAGAGLMVERLPASGGKPVPVARVEGPTDFEMMIADADCIYFTGANYGLRRENTVLHAFRPPDVATESQRR